MGFRHDSRAQEGWLMPEDLTGMPHFEGDESALRRILAALPPGSFYTYVLVDPAGTPFYVGKGTATRALQHRLEALRQSHVPKSNPFKCNRIRQILAAGQDLTYRIDRVYAAEAQHACLLREEALIARYRRRSDGGTLANLAAGLGSLAAPDPFSRERHAATLSGASDDRPERTALNLFLRALGGLDSVPVKPVSEYRSRMVSAYPSPKALKTLSRRNGLTIAAAALASGLRLAPGVTVPRVFVYRPDAEDWPLTTPPPERVLAVIENGALSDILKLGLATLVPAQRIEDEAITLDAVQITRLTGVLGRPALVEWGLLED
jgi:uncharacterized protein